MQSSREGILTVEEDYSDLPIDPDEAVDLRLHVRNCVKRHTALVHMISNDRIITWLYRAATLPLLAAIAAKMWGLQL